MGEQLVADLLAAIDVQNVIVPGTDAAERVLPLLGAALRTTVDDRQRTAGEVEEILDHHPLAKVLTSMPGTGVRTAARLLLLQPKLETSEEVDGQPLIATESNPQIPAPSYPTREGRHRRPAWMTLRRC